MNYAAIKLADCANGIGCRTVLFVSGCTHHCDECFQPETWNFQFGKPFTEETEDFLVGTLSPFYVDGLSILGGEPMEPVNQRGILSLVKRTKETGKDIWVYSGYTFEELTDKNNTRCRCEVTDELLSMIDTLVDGEFHKDEKDITLKFRGSKNQRIIDVQSSLKNGFAVEREEFK